MPTINIHEAETHLSRYLEAVENGEEFLIVRGCKPIARLVPVESSMKRPRPKVGDITGPPFIVPDSAFAPLTEEELKEWGL